MPFPDAWRDTRLVHSQRMCPRRRIRIRDDGHVLDPRLYTALENGIE